jgi:hypothetical protein
MALLQIGNRILNTDAISWVQYTEDAVLVYLNHPETAIGDTEDDAEDYPLRWETAWMVFEGLAAEVLRKYLAQNVITLLPYELDDSNLVDQPENEETDQN